MSILSGLKGVLVRSIMMYAIVSGLSSHTCILGYIGAGSNPIYLILCFHNNRIFSSKQLQIHLNRFYSKLHLTIVVTQKIFALGCLSSDVKVCSRLLISTQLQRGSSVIPLHKQSNFCSIAQFTCCRMLIR